MTSKEQAELYVTEVRKSPKAHPRGASMRATQKTTLLTLPPEVFNAICEPVLLEAGFVTVPHRMTEPGLLQVNRELRNTLQTMYYSRNTFGITVDGFDVEPFVPFVLRVKRHCASVKNPTQSAISWTVRTPRDWDNLERWVQLMCEHGEMFGLGDIKTHVDPEFRALVGVFDVVKTIIRSGGGWHVVKDVLVGMREAMGAVHSDYWS